MTGTPAWEVVRSESEVRRAYLEDVFVQVEWAIDQLPGKMRDIDIAVVRADVAHLSSYLEEQGRDTWLGFLLSAALLGAAGAAAPLLLEFMAAGTVYALAAASAGKGLGRGPAPRFASAREAVDAWTRRFPGAITTSAGAGAATSTLERLLEQPRPLVAATEAHLRTTTLTQVAGYVKTEFSAEQRALRLTLRTMEDLEADEASRERLWELIITCDAWVEAFSTRLRGQPPDGDEDRPGRPERTLLADYRASGGASVGRLAHLGEQLLRQWVFSLTALMTEPHTLVARTPGFYAPYRNYHVRTSQGGPTTVLFSLQPPSRYLGASWFPHEVRDVGFGYWLDGRAVIDRVEPTGSAGRVLAGLTDKPVFWSPPDFDRTFLEAADPARFRLRPAAQGSSLSATDVRRIEASYGSADHDRWLQLYRRETAVAELVAALQEYRTRQVWAHLVAALEPYRRPRVDAVSSG